MSTFDPQESYSYRDSRNQYDDDVDSGFQSMGDIPRSTSPTSASRDGHGHREPHRYSNASSTRRDPDFAPVTTAPSSGSGRRTTRWSTDYAGRTTSVDDGYAASAQSHTSLPARLGRDARPDPSYLRADMEAASAAFSGMSVNEGTRISHFPSPPHSAHSVSNSSSMQGQQAYANVDYNRPLPSPPESFRSPTMPVQGPSARATRPEPPRTTFDSRQPRVQPPVQPASQMPPLRVPFQCVFTQQPNGELHIMGADNAQTRELLYIVTVHMNVLIPTSYITMIRRGRSPNELVAKFE